MKHKKKLSKDYADVYTNYADDSHLQYMYTRRSFESGYDKGYEECMRKASEWWYEHLLGFLNEGLAKGVIKQFETENVNE